MPKSLDVDFLGLYGALLKECHVRYPDHKEEWDRDLSRLTLLYRSRGSKVFTMDLPALGKALDLSLDRGILTMHGVPLSWRNKNRSHVPRLFAGLWSRIFDTTSGAVRQGSDMDIPALYLLRQLLHCCKKVRSDCGPKATYKAVEGFFQVDASLPFPSQKWDDPDCDFTNSAVGGLVDRFSVVELQPDLLRVEQDPEDSSLLGTIQHVADIVSTSLGWFDPSKWRFRQGPGRVSDKGPGEYKYSFEHWPDKLESVFPYADYGVSSYSAIEYTASNGQADPRHHLEMPSKLVAVPKTMKGPRLIASEPTSHQWCQQALKDFLYARVHGSFLGESIRFDDQALSGTAALQASYDLKRATLDLSDASDRISCWLVERIFRRNPVLLSALSSVRTRWLVNRIDKKRPKFTRLRKYTTMGSATTFPIQSIVFYTICVGAGLLSEGYYNPRQREVESYGKKVRIFGDDLIVPTKWVPFVRRALELLYLKVNVAKTFANGRFRESCGVDAYAGYDVTPVYVLETYSKTRPSSFISVVDQSNNLFIRGFWAASDWLRKTLPRRLDSRMPVVHPDEGILGYHSFCGRDLSHLDKKWDDQRHRWLYRVPRVSTRVRRLPQDSSQCLLQYFTEAPSPDIVWTSGVDTVSETLVSLGWEPCE
ncbi:MAG: putative replicase protein [Shiltuvirus faecivicinum]|uniref:RNA-directed RNA polymerase n=1 Tax=Leviviridae sp. TaxID=2027243 RepID=A0ABY3SV30_9VIRU|nr:MAG: putative replicase protein [Leviviridae sp.]